MLEVRPGAVAFRHELARRAVVESLPVTVRLERNARVAAALLAGPAPDLARVLHHTVEAGDDAAVVRHGPTVAREASRAGAHRQAVAAYEQVLARSVLLDPVAHAALLDAYAWSLYNINRLHDAAAAAPAPPSRSRNGTADPALVRYLVTLSRQHWLLRRTADALASARRADDLGRGGTCHAAARVNLGAILVLVDREEEGLPHLDPGDRRPGARGAGPQLPRLGPAAARRPRRADRAARQRGGGPRAGTARVRDARLLQPRGGPLAARTLRGGGPVPRRGGRVRPRPRLPGPQLLRHGPAAAAAADAGGVGRRPSRCCGACSRSAPIPACSAARRVPVLARLLVRQGDDEAPRLLDAAARARPGGRRPGVARAHRAGPPRAGVARSAASDVPGPGRPPAGPRCCATRTDRPRCRPLPRRAAALAAPPRRAGHVVPGLPAGVRGGDRRRLAGGRGRVGADRRPVRAGPGAAGVG